MVAFGSIALWLYMRWENAQRAAGKRDHRLEGKTADEIAVMGAHHPLVRRAAFSRREQGH
jgi:hypothetical protein